MGIWDKLKKGAKKVVSKAKETYKKADKKVGGVLPGGAPRSERVESGIKKVKEKIIQPVKFDVRPQATKDRAAASKETKIQSNVVPFSGAAVGALSATTSYANKIKKAVSGKDMFKSYTTLTKSAPVLNKVNVAQNAKNAGLIETVMGNTVSKKALALVGGAGAWASMVFWGKWGQAEAPEPLSIAMGDAFDQAQKSGDWSLYDEAAAARNELIDLTLLERIGLNSPLSPFIGITNKMKGAAAGAAVMDKIAENEKIAMETGESSDEKWARIRQEEADQEVAMVDYYNEQRKMMVEWEREASVNARNEDAAFWRKERNKTAKKEAEDRKATADFWLAYRKKSLELSDANRPSNLNFGIL